MSFERVTKANDFDHDDDDSKYHLAPNTNTIDDTNKSLDDNYLNPN